MSVLPVWIPGSSAKPTSRTRPGACDTSLEPSRKKKLIHEKKPLCGNGAPAVQENAFLLLAQRGV